jgi:cytochrome b pre-mRNA-processing protein 3
LLQSLFRPRRSKAAASRLYAAVVAQARSPAFYRDLGAPDTIEGRFELYSLHVILLLHRLRGAGPGAAEAAQGLFDTYVSALDNALRETGVGDLSVPRRMRRLGEAFYGRAKAFEAALGAEDDVLEALVGRTVFAGEGGEEHPAALAAYVRRCVAALTAQPLGAILDGEARRGGARRLVADARARKAIAAVLDLESLDALEADITLSPWLDGAAIEGRWQAEIVQICSVSLDPFTTLIAGSFLVRVVPPGSPNAPVVEQEIVIDPDAEDPPDELAGETIDLGDYVVEHLALELDPFPRRPGVEFEAPAEPAAASPFDVLARLKRE